MVDSANKGRQILVSYYSFFCSWLMLADHAIHFSIRSAMTKRQELMSHPRKVMISFGPPLASIFRIEAESGHLIGSNAPAMA